ncbi:hypothetical protein QCM80_45425 [Bradyrhizobium sp. SSUT112]|nr:hypothetical protein [Bradyrhizobium sp. SSUT112]MDH2357706.1 hypothetical protein [Bradyrhizobium sp. SSUT112]
MKATLETISTGHPLARIDELMPWSFGRTLDPLLPLHMRLQRFATR